MKSVGRDKCKVKGLKCNLNMTSSSGTLLLIAYVIIVLPLASPYGIGIHADRLGPIQRRQANHIATPTSKLNALPFTADKIKSSTTATTTTTVLNVSNVEFEIDDKKENRLKRFWRKYRPKDETIGTTSKLQPQGEHEANLISRLFYNYVSPLVELASVRHLQSSDAFVTPITKKMDTAVPDLQQIYDKCRLKARRHQEILKSTEGRNISGDNRRLKRRINERIAKSQSLVLAKALILHQKRTLIMTGCLRLINTTIQAFPALLVARLLRIIESGESLNLRVSFQASLQLVAVLLLKMVVENQYFHFIVLGATQVRGALSGLIFDKTLKISSGGASATVDSKEVDGGKDDTDSENQSTELGAGGVINLMQSDTSIIELAAVQVHTSWDGILQLAIYSTLLYRLLGPPVLWGFGVLLLQIPLNVVGLRVLNRLSKKQNEAKDARTKRTTEAITNMKLLKLQAWDKIFEDKISKHREVELKRHIDRGTFRAFNSAISNAVPAIILVVTLAAYKKSGSPIVASTIFTAISLFNQLRFPLFFYPLLIDAMANGKQSLRRLSSYLCQEELSQYVQNYPRTVEGGGRIEMRNGNFLWSSAKIPSGSKTEVSPAAAALCGVELNVNPGEVVAVVGPVGSGKTALIKALLGELEPAPRIVVDGMLEPPLGSTPHFQSDNSLTTMDVPSVSTNGGVAYCAQESWLSKGTIREAILFGREYDEERYLSAIYDAGLDDDIVGDNSADGKPEQGLLTHNTEVGEGGSSLSGGQRARVQLARALYHHAGVYILDDPLSALDAAVGATVFERMTSSLRRRKAAVIFVTNDPSLPKRCDRVILMGNVQSGSGSPSCSSIVDTGTTDELISRGHNLQSSIPVHDTTPASFDPIDQNEIALGYADPDSYVTAENNSEYVSERSPSATPESNADTQHGTKLKNVADGNSSNANSSSQPVRTKEKTMDDMMTTGAVPLSTYIKYLKSVRKPQLIALALACVVMVNGAQFFQQFVVAKWTELGQGTAMSTALGGRYLRSLAYAAVTVSVFLFLRGYTIMQAGVRASDYFHNRMLSTVFSAPVSFFDTTPSGQFLARFGKEMETIDRSVPDSIASVLYCFLQIFMTVIGLAGVITPKILLPLVPIGLYYRLTMSRYRPASRDLKRCESKSRSPIYTHFGEALRGADTIRSFYGTTAWSVQNRQLTDDNLSVFYTLMNLQRWLSIRLESLGNLVVLSAAFASVIMTRTGRLTAGGAGWGLTQTLLITGLMAWAVRVLTDLESQMMSVMRVSELINPESTQSIGSFPSNDGVQMVPFEMSKPGDGFSMLSSVEASHVTASAPDSDHDLIKSGWPWKGGISFKEVSMRYNINSPLVLKNVTILVPPGSTLVRLIFYKL